MNEVGAGVTVKLLDALDGFNWGMALVSPGNVAVNEYVPAGLVGVMLQVATPLALVTALQDSEGDPFTSSVTVSPDTGWFV